MTTAQRPNPGASAPKHRAAAVPEPVDISIVCHADGSHTFHGPEGPPVRVTEHGDLYLTWGSEDWLALRFRLADDSPDSLFRGVELEWSTTPMAAIDSPRPRAHFELVSEPDPDGRRRAVGMIVHRNAEVFPYALNLIYKGDPYRIDPKIYNEGDG